VSMREQRQVASDAGLSKQRVVVEAVRLADREGVDGLSMRRLAGALGAGAMSPYHYVANKEELLDAMIDIVFEENELPPAEQRPTGSRRCDSGPYPHETCSGDTHGRPA
jgi:AcrR family transcriptional regulator